MISILWVIKNICPFAKTLKYIATFYKLLVPVCPQLMSRCYCIHTCIFAIDCTDVNSKYCCLKLLLLLCCPYQLVFTVTDAFEVFILACNHCSGVRVCQYLLIFPPFLSSVEIAWRQVCVFTLLTLLYYFGRWSCVKLFQFSCF